MPRIDEETRSRRKERVWLEVRQHNGIRQSEITKRLQLENRTVNNYLRELWDEGKVFREGVLWHSLPYQETRLRRFALSPEEAMTIYLATRLYVKQQDRRHEAAESALYRLAEVLSSDAGVGEEIRQAANELARRDTDLQYSRIFREVVRGYIYRRRLQITYQPNEGKPFDTTFAVYLLEPSAIGYATYMIGHSSIVDDQRSFKIERIQAATLTNEAYAVPDDFPGLDILRNAWSIIAGEKTQCILLRFSPNVKGRVLETQWHPSQAWEDDPEKPGYLRWWVDVADTTDMKPWIRGWGSDVEVLEPDQLRESVRKHVHRMSLTYGVGPQSIDQTSRLLRLWGKTSKKTETFHPALYHMLDVAHIAQQLLSQKATLRWRRVLSRTLDSDLDTLHEWLPWFIALHDIGKISIPFQAQNNAQKQRLGAEGFDFGSYSAEHRSLYHPMIGRIVLKQWVESFPLSWRTVFLDMVAGHHGNYQHPERKHNRLWTTLQEPEEWQALRRKAIHILRAYLLLHEPDSWPQPTNISAAIVALNGFTILCDWLGSDEDYFTPMAHMQLSDYLMLSRQQARARVESAGFFTPTLSLAPTGFFDLFGWQPRPLQQAVNEIPGYLLTLPSLTIMEAPTGEGKTEAALTLAHRIGQAQGSDEMYIALPTTATSNAMFIRIREHLHERLGLPASSVKLIHGQDFLVEDDLVVSPLNNGNGQSHPALSWFAPKKRALLASFGVGTVDQAELAALNVRHNALRLIGLAGKVIILDEVHAYDTYMTTIILRMLNWLSALGCSVILLSATLPTAKRRQLVEEYTQAQLDLHHFQDYPLMLVAAGEDSFSATPQPQQERKTIQLHTLHFAEEDWISKAEWLIAQTENGGCVCWMTNTVHRAQHIYEAVRAIAPAEIECDLLHARFPIEDRQKKEENILAKYGKAENGRRPKKGIIVGTQVLEQSLDIDFDLLVSDLAPIDLLLQRIGRLHRHPERSNRDEAHPSPHVFVNCVLDQDSQLVIGSDRFYTPYILRKTWQVLQTMVNGEGEFVLPQDYRPLIETVYDETPPSEDSALFTDWQERRKKDQKYQDEARIRLANEPDPHRPFWRGHNHPFEEDEDSANWIVAQTRYQERESITIIPMERQDSDTARLAGTNEQVVLNKPVDRETQIRLLRRSVRLSNYYVVSSLREEGERDINFSLFTQSALLKRCFPLWFSDGVWSISIGEKIISVRLDQDLGLIINIKDPHESGESV